MSSVTYSIPDFQPVCEKAINDQLYSTVYGMYTYMTMAAFFQNVNVSLQGMYKFSEYSANRHYKELISLSEYQNRRGGEVVLPDVQSSTGIILDNALAGMETAQYLEYKVYKTLIDSHEDASSCNDYEMTQFLEKKMSAQLPVLKFLGDAITQLNRVGRGPSHGEFYYDHELEELMDKNEDIFGDNDVDDDDDDDDDDKDD